MVAQLREQRLPEKHFRPTPQEPHEDESPSKKPRLITLPPNQQVQHIPVKTLLNSGGGIVAVSKAPIQPVHPGGLLHSYYCNLISYYEKNFYKNLQIIGL